MSRISEREEYGTVRINPDKSINPVKPLRPFYSSMIIDEHNDGYVILTSIDGEIRMRASSKAIDTINTILDSEEIIRVMISYRKNILFSQEYKISGIRESGGKGTVFYISHLKRHDDFFLIDLAAARRNL